MAVLDCIKKMGFTDDEAKTIFGDVGSNDPSKAIGIVEKYIRDLQGEHADIMKQAAPPKAAEPAGAKMEPAMQQAVTQLASTHPDMEVTLPDGSTVPASQLPEKIAQQLASAEQDSNLHDAAIACFLRTL